MPLHLIKLAVGISDLDHLAEVQARRTHPSGEAHLVPVHTRQLPKRGAEILEGGSLYWVVRGTVAVRQRVLTIDTGVDGDGKGFCLFGLDRTLVPTVATPHRPFQGWRYLAPEAAPRDLSDAGGEGDLPEPLAAELRALGLL